MKAYVFLFILLVTEVTAIPIPKNSIDRRADFSSLLSSILGYFSDTNDTTPASQNTVADSQAVTTIIEIVTLQPSTVQLGPTQTLPQTGPQSNVQPNTPATAIVSQSPINSQIAPNAPNTINIINTPSTATTSLSVVQPTTANLQQPSQLVSPTASIVSSDQQPTSSSQPASDTNGAFDPSSAFSSAMSATYSSFWDNSNQMFSINDLSCQSFDAPAVWPIAVMGNAAVFSGNPNYIGQLLSNLYQYYNSAGWFSASTSKDDDVYIDDNAQVAWVFLDAYKQTKNQAHLNQGQSLVNLIQTQWNSNGGGVRWQLNGEYIASISTTEAALAAVKLYEYTNDPSLLQFADNCLDYIDNVLTDPSDGLIYDGYQINNGQTNKGKLTYTVGVMMSTLAYLNKYTGNSTYIDRATKLANAATNKQGAFYNSNGYWNNALKYVHLLFVGFSDLITLTSGDYSNYIAEVQRQAQYIYQYLQVEDTGNYFDSVYSYTPAMYQKFSKSFTPSQSFSPSPSNFCHGNLNGAPLYSFMDDASAAQIMHAASKL